MQLVVKSIVLACAGASQNCSTDTACTLIRNSNEVFMFCKTNRQPKNVIWKVLARTTAQGVPEAQLREAVAGAVAAHDADGDGRLAPPEFRDLVLASVSGQPAA